MSYREKIKVSGMGFMLPNLNGVCDTRDKFWSTIKEGRCNISPLNLDKETAVKIAGQIYNLDVAQLGISPKYEKKYSRATLLGVSAIKNALVDAKLDPKEISNDRTLLVICSAFFTLENLTRQYNTYYEEGINGLGFDYMLSGTPGSITSTISMLLKLDCPVLTISGSCVISSHALEIAYDRIRFRQIDRAIILGVDAPIAPLYLSSTSYVTKDGTTLSSLSPDPKSVKPHDKNSLGNACGEGAVAIVLEGLSDEEVNTVEENTTTYKLYFHNSRKSGVNPVASGEPDNYGKSVKALLDKANINMSDVGFINDFCEGTKFIEDFFCKILQYIRAETDYYGEIILTNQEAAFGHIPGPSSLIKLLSNIMMMENDIITPSINCEQIYEKLDALAVIGKPVHKKTNYSLTISGGAGGDCAAILIQKCNGKD